MAALAGVDLSVAKRGLVNLANIVGGDLEVSKDGGRILLSPCGSGFVLVGFLKRTFARERRPPPQSDQCRFMEMVAAGLLVFLLSGGQFLVPA